MSHTLDSFGRIKLAFGSGSVWPFNIITVSASGNADYTTIQDAIDAASAGDTILIDAGTFAEDLTINTAVTLVGFSMFSTIISSSTANSQAVNITTDDVRLKNLSITSTGTGSSAGCVLTSGLSVTLDDCWLFKTSGAATVNYGLKAVSGGTTNLYGCLITVSGGTSNYGIYIDNASTVFCDRGYISATTLDLYVFHASAVLQLNSTVLANNTVTNNGTITDLSNVSRVMQSDFQGVALSADATGNLSTAYNVTLTGATKAILGSGSNVPDIGSATTAAKFGNIYLGASKDVFAFDDTGGLFTRGVDFWQTPTDHFTTFSGYTWATHGTFDGAPSTVDTTTYPSLLSLINDNIAEDHYAYKADSGTIDFYARLWVGSLSFAGIRLDDGTDNNYLELRLQDGTDTTLKSIMLRYRTGGGAVTTTTVADGIPGQFYVLRLSYSDAANTGFAYYGVNTPFTSFIGSYGGPAWSVTNSGIIFSQRGTANATDRSALFDWIKY